MKNISLCSNVECGMMLQSDNVELGMWNVECGMMGILPCKIRLYSIDDTDSRQSPLI